MQEAGELGLRRIGLAPVEYGSLMKGLWEATPGASISDRRATVTNHLVVQDMRT